MMSIIIPLLLRFVVVVIVLYLSVRVVNQYERLVVFRLGGRGPSWSRTPASAS